MVVIADLAVRDDPQLSRWGNVAYAHRMSSHTEDSALMLRYKDGDVAAFEALYRRHNDSLYRYLLHLSQNRAAAEDVFQDVWSKIIKSRDNYRPTARFSTFLFRVAHNCFIDYVRRNKRHAHNAAIDPDSRPNPADEPELATEKGFARRRMANALQTLPEEQRDVFLLYEEAGLSIDAIATATGVNRETAKSRLRYAVTKLKAALAEPGTSSEGVA
jgi:RNA polymerase sigma-70 factor (ECF subfamily)